MNWGYNTQYKMSFKVKCEIEKIENLTSNIFFGYQAFKDNSADKLIVAHSFEIWNKKLGSVMYIRGIDHNIQI